MTSQSSNIQRSLSKSTRRGGYLLCRLTDGGMAVIDLAVMNTAQIWKEAYKLPSEQEVDSAIGEHYEWVTSLARSDSVYFDIVNLGSWYKFLNNAADTSVDENLDYSEEVWKFWWRERGCVI